MGSEGAGLVAAREQIIRFWGGVAAEYDAGPSGGIGDEAEHRAWLGILGELLSPVPGDVLDVGTGPGVMAFLAAELGHRATGIDLAEEMLAVARSKPALLAPLSSPVFALGDAVDPPFSPASFDVILSRFVFWTLLDPASALANWLRLLRPGGRLVAFDIYRWVRETRESPDFADDAWYRQHQGDYAAMAGMRPPLQALDSLGDIAAFVRRAGFADVRVRRMAALEAQLAEVMARIPPELGGPFPIHLITATRP